VNWSALEVGDPPSAVVTVTFTVPAVPAGAVAVISVEETTVKLAAGFEPKSTAVAPVRFVPVMVTLVPPAGSPASGDTDVTVGPPEVTTLYVAVVDAPAYSVSPL
jgi:hypothetical protein